MLELGIDGKSAFVAGVGSGIGIACVEVLARAGASVACFDIDEGTAQTASEAGGDDAIALTGDARSVTEVGAAFDAAVEAFGSIDIAVDVIGEARWGRTITLDDTAWDDSFDLVLRHFFNLSRVA